MACLVLGGSLALPLGCPRAFTERLVRSQFVEGRRRWPGWFVACSGLQALIGWWGAGGLALMVGEGCLSFAPRIGLVAVCSGAPPQWVQHLPGRECWWAGRRLLWTIVKGVQVSAPMLVR